MQSKTETLALLVVVISLFSMAIGAPSKVKVSIDDSEEKTVKREADTNVNIRKTFSGLGKSYVLTEEGFLHVKEARAFCQKLNGDLASNLSVNDFDNVLAKNLHEEDFWRIVALWVGAERDGTEDGRNSEYKWITGEPIPSNFEKWASWEPDGQCCGVLMLSRGNSGNIVLGTVNDPFISGFHMKARALCQIH